MLGLVYPSCHMIWNHKTTLIQNHYPKSKPVSGFRNFLKMCIKIALTNSVTFISKAKATIVRAERTTTRTAGIDTSPELSSRYC